MSKYITARIDVMGGHPVITGTRVPIEVILHRLKEGYSIKEIHNLYPWVDVKTLEGAIEEVKLRSNLLRNLASFTRKNMSKWNNS